MVALEFIKCIIQSRKGQKLKSGRRDAEITQIEVNEYT